ncbi:hypothetical protein, unknown function [Leishmania infantum JPCM5]|uniref:Uncharacterized protein n=2 Tax=Leishmania infantum TaxID=5671 RepID=A4HUI9_LEIIN|nr:hypothetical protein, unknown function [Leishmania infantum JPCM5]CAM66097.2 hypothetical protein, unknown function [Leishmania infantum JPCM5]|eukprot:XP_001463730.2 hypothetical protein, unknown function [Leishmania infantum JPCM5]
MSTEELIACLLGLPSSSPASPPPRMQQRWLAFVHLCDSLVRRTASPSKRGVAFATTSTSVGAPRHSLVGVIVPCKEVYFSDRHLKASAARTAPPTLASASLAASSFAEDMSTTQAALFLFHHHWRVPVTLAINTAVPNSAPSATESRGCTHPRSPGEQAAAHAAATPDGIDAVVTDFVFAQGGRRLLLVRGDSPPDVRLCLSEGSPNGPLSGALGTGIAEEASPLQQAHRALRTGAELVHHVSTLRDQQLEGHKPCDGGTRASALELCVAGYPQGHPLDRTWGATSAAYSASAEAAATGSVVTGDSSVAAARQRSLEFLREFEKDFDAAEHAFTAAVCVAKRRACVVSTEKRSGEPRERARHLCRPQVAMPELKELCRTLGRLGAVRRLWTSFSIYAPHVRAACIHRMLHEKVLLRSPSELQHRRIGSCSFHGGAAAPVIVTQMITTAKEFTDYVEEIQRGLRAWAATAAGGEQPEPAGDGPQQQRPVHEAAPTALTPISVIPGVLLPHPTDAHVLLRSLYYTKVIPSARMQKALEVYASELMTAWRQLADEHPRRKREPARQDDTFLQALTEGNNSAATLEISEDRVAQVEARVREVRRCASCRLTSAWLSETVDLLHDLQRHGQARVHLFTMFNDKVDVRVAQLLAAYDAQRGASAEQ